MICSNQMNISNFQKLSPNSLKLNSSSMDNNLFDMVKTAVSRSETQESKSEPDSSNPVPSSSVQPPSQLETPRNRKSLSVLYSLVNEDEQINDRVSFLQKELRGIKMRISAQSKANFSLERDDLASRLEDVKSHSQRTIPSEAVLQKYGNLFYLLQSEPVHIASLTRLVSLSEIDILLQIVMFTLYGNQYESREEHLLLTMFQLVLSNQFEHTTEFSSLLRANTPVSRMMMTYTRRSPGQSYLKNIIAPLINAVTENPALDLEINPSKVLDEMRAAEGQFSLPRIVDETVETEKLNSIISPRINELTLIANKFLNAILSNINSVPYGIRWICKQIKSLTKRKYPTATNKEVCSLIGGFFFLRFINPAIVTPQAYMLIDADPTKNPRRTLTLIAKLLQSLANKPSYSKEAYMEVFQPFIEQNQVRINEYLLELCDVPDFYDSLEMDQYMSLTRKELSLSISLNEIYNTHTLLCNYVDSLAPAHSSKLQMILDDLGPVPNPVSRGENITIELKLYSRWETPIKTTLEVMASQNEFTLHDIMYIEAKSILVQILRSMPQLGAIGPGGQILSKQNLRKTSSGKIDILYIAQQAATSRDSVLVRKGIKVRELLHELEKANVISISNDYCTLSEEVFAELEHLGNLHEQLETEYENLKSVYKTIQGHNEYLLSQIETYRAYLINARIQAGLVSNGNRRQKMRISTTPVGVLLSQSNSPSKQRNKHGFGKGNRSNSNQAVESSQDFPVTEHDSGNSSESSPRASPQSPTVHPLGILNGLSSTKEHKSNSMRLPFLKSNKSGVFRFTHSQLEQNGVISVSNVPINRRNNLFFDFSSPGPSSFKLELLYKGRDKPILYMSLILDDLLEKQSENVQTLDIEYVILSIPHLLELFAKTF
ncbi:hypothetical protein BB560_005515 [Smittium megazygosporum]|uniref:Ras-GAP domain-containing protein n=1 Tax=Smittium megazygosporum TaxID=133381 RepID=A0A2T9Z414_9FUNG|nr:hypothetical protein BB560_005515 [Smittium megazygosporum]